MNWRIFNPFRPRSKIKLVSVYSPYVHFPEACISSLAGLLQPTLRRRHEGVVFLLGRTDGTNTTVLSVVRPRAVTSPGSFDVSAEEVARVVELAFDADLQIVGQVHTHPKDAFHSDGDEDGANISFDGFISIVLPDYGARLPDLSGAAVYQFHHSSGWLHLAESRLRVVDAGIALDGR